MRAFPLRPLLGVGGLLLGLVACGGDAFDAVDTSAGAGGASGGAGTAGASGTAGTAGTGGSSAGSSGAGAGGSAGNAGAGGDAGSDGGTGGDGGSGGDAGAGGDAGSGGSSGDAGAAGSAGSSVDPCANNQPPSAQPQTVILKSSTPSSALPNVFNDAEDGKDGLSYTWLLTSGDPQFAPFLNDTTKGSPTATPVGWGAFLEGDFPGMRKSGA